MLIIDMPMPKNCKECPAKEWGGACAITKQFEMCEGRPSWCPIKGELVRCGGCKYFKDGMCYNPNTYDDEKTCGNTTADWFCADGERKDVEHE